MVVLTNRRMVWIVRRGSVTFWAWIASFAVHLIVLSAFGVVKFSPCRQWASLKAQGQHRPAPVAKVRQVRRLIDSAPIIPKPRIKKILPAAGNHRRSQVQHSRLWPTPVGSRLLLPKDQPPSQDRGDLIKPSVPAGGFSGNSSILPKGIEFFGSRTEERKVCYLVDCSGSMQGIFGQVRKRLKESIEDLQPDQYFYIIFFGGDRLVESGDGRLVRAAQKAKSAAYDFIDSVQPAGQTSALAALERAVQIQDSRGACPSIIYFLTDGFELTTKDAQWFGRRIADLLKRFAPTTRINTIGFWPTSDDRKLLEAIAAQSGGEFVFISDGDS